MAHRTALVLGATGMVGSALAQSLVEEGWEVYGAARFSGKKKPKQLEQIEIEPIPFDVVRDDPARLPDVDVLFLEIWDPSKPDLTWAINFYGVGRVVDRFAGIAEVVNGSTINVYGDSPQIASEDTACRPTSNYGRSRYAQERLIDYFSDKSGVGGIHIRYAHANTAEQGIVRRFAEAIARSESLGADPDARLQVIALEDFVRVTRLAVGRAECPPTVVNCCHPRVWTKRELAETIRERLGQGEVVFDQENGGLEQSAYADTTRMIEWFGEPTVPLDTVIARVVDDVTAQS